MSGRSMSFAVAAVLLLPLTGAPETLQYRIIQKFQQTVDLTEVGQGEQKVDGEAAMFVTLHTRDSAGGWAIHAIVDSVVMADGTNPQVAAGMAMMRGVSGSGFVDAEREVHGFDADSGAAASVKGLVHSVMPRLKAGTKAGQTWADTTTSNDTPAGGGSLTRTTRTTYSTAAGSKGGLSVTSSSDYELAGLIQGGMALEGTGKSMGTFSVGPGGWLQQGTFSDTASMSVMAPQAPNPIPIINVTTSTVERLN